MKSPVQGLGSRCPLEMLGTRVETEAVLYLIGRLERGRCLSSIALHLEAEADCYYRTFGPKRPGST
ncbi:antitoxin Xre/MbcA/ParS toxin-binding domain-containing protein [Pseudomonas sp. BF-B-25]|uniref:antitoxin Xre/MbcA/ParS toxin-binding domain-containing protein n=1 Tax=Pseudomonas sp. BF-B-25 TaxID=2832355 RepID=UPI001CBF5666